MKKTMFMPPTAKPDRDFVTSDTAIDNNTLRAGGQLGGQGHIGSG